MGRAFSYTAVVAAAAPPVRHRVPDGNKSSWLIESDYILRIVSFHSNTILFYLYVHLLALPSHFRLRYAYEIYILIGNRRAKAGVSLPRRRSSCILLRQYSQFI